MFYDLHVHTTASDGEDTPETVVRLAVEMGLGGLAITDHDSVGGLEPAREFIRKNRLKIDLIPGIELNTDYGDDDVHILGYFIDAADKYLRRRISEIKEQRCSRAGKIIARLKDMGINIDFDQVKDMAQGDLIGRPHIARVLYLNGYAGSADEAFARYIARDRPAYVPRYKFTPAEAVTLVKQSGGIAVLAHPGLIKDDREVLDIINIGIEGLEVYYPEHSREQIKKYTLLARENNLLITGGSDYHGPGSKESRGSLGSAGIDEAMAKRLKVYYREKTKD